MVGLGSERDEQKRIGWFGEEGVDIDGGLRK